MGFVQELKELVDNARFHRIVYQFQQGLYFRNGKIKPIRKRLSKEERGTAWTKEKGLIEEIGGYSKFLPFRRPALPKEFTRSWITGLPLHTESRFTEILTAGFYFHLPFIDHIETGSTQTFPMNVGTSNVMAADGTPISVSCNFMMQMVDFKKAYLIVHDFKETVEVHAVSVLAKHVMGEPLDNLRNRKNVQEIEAAIFAELTTLVTDQWGIKISELRITDLVPSTTIRHVTDGQTLTLIGHLKTESVTPEN